MEKNVQIDFSLLFLKGWMIKLIYIYIYWANARLSALTIFTHDLFFFFFYFCWTYIRHPTCILFSFRFLDYFILFFVELSNSAFFGREIFKRDDVTTRALVYIKNDLAHYFCLSTTLTVFFFFFFRLTIFHKSLYQLSWLASSRRYCKMCRISERKIQYRV